MSDMNFRSSIMNDLMLTPTSSLSGDKQNITINEIKQEKSAETKDIYPEMIKNLGNKALAWLAAAIFDIIRTSKYQES